VTVPDCWVESESAQWWHRTVGLRVRVHSVTVPDCWVESESAEKMLLSYW